jgi:dUTP pyrophosphatase
MKLNVKLTDGAPLPKHAKPGDAGLDLTTRETVTLEPGETKIVGTGVSVEIPKGCFGLVVPRSGLGSRGINLSNCVGVIDSGYRGEIKAPLHNNHPTVFHAMGRIMASHDTMTIERGERVCQLIVVPFVTCECVEVDELSDTERGTDGFGSTDG